MKLSAADIAALGGNASDLELIDGVDSEDEVLDVEQVRKELGTILEKKESKKPVKTAKVKQPKKQVVQKKATRPEPVRKDIKHGKLLFESNENWFGVALAGLVANEDASEQEISGAYENAKSLYESQVEIHQHGITIFLKQ